MRRFMLHRRAALLSPLALAGLAARAGAPVAIRVAIAEGEAPHSYRDPGGRMTGMIVDGLAAVSGPLSWTLEFLGVPWARAQLLVQQDKADAHVTVATDSRRRYMRFAHEPLYTINTAVLHFLRDNRRAGELRALHSIEGLRDFRMVALIGDAWHVARFANWKNVEWMRTTASCFTMIAAGRADLTLESRESLRFASQSADLSHIESREVSFVPDGVAEFRFGLRTSFANAETLLADYDGAQRSARASGALKRAMAKYR
jgi:polar amino acid transport system substrate-binding protein